MYLIIFFHILYVHTDLQLLKAVDTVLLEELKCVP